MIIGNFTYDAKSDVYIGDLTTLTSHRSGLMFRPLEKSSENEPDYRIVAQGAFGFVEFGAAWKRKSEKGQDFLSVSIDDPALSSALNAALFPAENGESAALVWNRKKPGKGEASAESRPANGSKMAKTKAK